MPCISGVESAFSCCRDTVVSSTASLLGKIWCFRLFPSFSHVPHENTSLLLLVESEKCTFLFFVTPFTFYYEVLKHPCWRDAVLSSISSWILLGQTWCFRLNFLLAYFTPEYFFVNGEWKVHFAMFLITPFIVKCLSIFLLYKRQDQFCKDIILF